MTEDMIMGMVVAYLLLALGCFIHSERKNAKVLSRKPDKYYRRRKS